MCDNVTGTPFEEDMLINLKKVGDVKTNTVSFENEVQTVIANILCKIVPLCIKKNQKLQTNVKYTEQSYVAEIIKFVSSSMTLWSKYKSNQDIQKNICYTVALQCIHIYIYFYWKSIKN